MERFSQRENVLLGYNLQRTFINSPVSSPKSQNGNSDIDFTDVFGGPPRRSFPQEMRCSFSAETTDSYASRKSDDDMNLATNRWSDLNEKPVFGEEGANRRRYPSNDFFDDIFRGNESVSSPPRKNERNSLSSTPGSTVSSPARPLPTRADPWSPSLPAQFSLPARLIKGTDLPTFVSSTRNHNKNKHGALNGVSNYTYSPLSRSASQRNEVQEELSNDVSWQSSLSKGLCLGREESSNLNNPEETDEGRNLKRDSDSYEASNTGSHFHFSVYKWTSKGIPFAMPLRGVNKSRLNACKLERCSSANGWIACEGITGELHMATPHDHDTSSFSSLMSSDAKGFGMDLDKNDNGFLFDSSTRGGGVEQCQIVEEAIPMSELAPSAHRVIFKDLPRKSTLHDSIEETKARSFSKMSSSGKTKEENSTMKQEARKTELKPLRSLLSECENQPGVDENEITTKNGLEERKVKSTKKFSAVFDVGEISEEQYGKRSTLNIEKMDKANLQVSPTSSRDDLGKNRVRGKVKEFVKIFNQGGSDKPKSDADSLRQGPRRKEVSKSRKEDATAKLNEKIHLPEVNNNVPEASILVDEYLKQCEKRDPENRANNIYSTRISSGRKGSSASTAALIPDGSEATNGDTDMSFLLITELPQDEDPAPRTSDNEEIQVIDDKIPKWSKGKEGNIRSLLSTLQYVLWSESGWKPVPLVDIVEGNAVKRTYQKALLCLHPDKLQQKGASSHQKYTAEKVFDILQEAWTHFNTLGAP